MFSLKSLFGAGSTEALKGADEIVDAVNRLEPKYKALTDEDLRKLTQDFRNRHPPTIN